MTARFDRRAGDRRRAWFGRVGRLPDALVVLLVLVTAGVVAGRAGTAWHARDPRPARSLESGCAERVQTRLFFGMDRPDGRVSEDDWNGFLAREITPRFPAGLTVTAAVGQWRHGNRHVQEPSRVVEIVHDDAPAATAAVARIVTRYKVLYGQESVMVSRVRLDVCFQ